MNITLDNIDHVAFGAGSLLPAIAQDIHTGEVLMLAWMNREALEQTLRRQRAVFWSRSRGALWEKGETSGNSLELIACHTDCDRDALLLLVKPKGPACHEGTLTCFAAQPLLPPDPLGFLRDLEFVIDGRIAGGGSESYTAKLLQQGPKRLAQKIGEEGVETALATIAGADDELVSESADLIYHLAVALRSRGLSLVDVSNELAKRHAAKR